MLDRLIVAAIVAAVVGGIKLLVSKGKSNEEDSNK